MNLNFLNNPYFLIVIYLSIILKGLALWRAGRLKQRNWFVAILVINFLGLLEIAYLLKFATKPLTLDEIKTWIPSKK